MLESIAAEEGFVLREVMQTYDALRGQMQVFLCLLCPCGREENISVTDADDMRSQLRAHLEEDKEYGRLAD